MDFSLKTIDNAGKATLLFSLSGTLAAGSEGNVDVSRARSALDSAAVEIDTVVFDLTNLKYEWGDALGTLWLACLRRRIPVTIVAHGNTRIAVQNLVKLSIPVVIVDSVDEALASF